MPHLSSKKLDKELSDKLFKDLVNILNKSQGKKFFPNLVSELLTETEKQMLAKRFAIVVMLDSKIPQHKITDILKVSPSTVAIASLRLENEKYKFLLSASKKERVDLEKIVWAIMTAGGLMQPKIGKKYWRKYSY